MERRAHPQLYHPSLEVDPLGNEEGGDLWETVLKTRIGLDCLKGRMQFGPADVKEL